MSDRGAKETRNAIVFALFKAGFSSGQIVEHADVRLSKSQVNRVLKRIKQDGAVEGLKRKVGSGRPRLFEPDSKEEKKVIAGLIKTNSVREAARHGQQAHASTIWRTAKRAGLKKKARQSKPRLSEAQKLARLEFALKHFEKPVDFWKSWIFSDEKKFVIFALQPSQWCRPGDVPAPQLTTVVPSTHYCWAAVSYLHRTKLVEIKAQGKERGLTVDKYRAILKKHLVPQIPLLVENPTTAIFMHDSTTRGTHGSLKVRGDFQKLTNEKKLGELCMPWPASSPDLNPIENVWHDVVQKVQRRHPKTRLGFKKAVNRCWGEVSQESIANTIGNMPERLAAVIAANGGHTRY